MFDIGIGEIIVLAILGLVVFGPERLPKAAADAGRLVRQLRGMASGARKDLADSAGVDLSDAKDALRDIADLHPRRIVSSLMNDEPEPKPKRTQTPKGDGPAPFDPDATRAVRHGPADPRGHGVVGQGTLGYRARPWPCRHVHCARNIR